MREPKYINAEQFVTKYGNWYTEEGTENGFIGTVKDLVEQMPAADVVKVVRCKDCERNPKDTWFGCPMAHCSETQRPEMAWCWKGERRKDG